MQSKPHIVRWTLVTMLLFVFVLPERIASAVQPASVRQWAATITNTTFSGSVTLPGSVQSIQVGNLQNKRYGHTATLLPNGQVLIVGGRINNDLVAQAELFNPATNTFLTTGSLNQVRSNHSATLLPNGKVLVAGGSSSYGSGMYSAELFDPATGTFTYTGSMNASRDQHVAVLLLNGKVLIAGGWTNGLTPLSSTELYDPATGTFAFTGSMSSGRPNTIAILLSTGKVLIAGGNNVTYRGQSSAEIYDPATGIFASTGSMTYSKRFHSAMLLADGRVLVMGGMGLNDSFDTGYAVETYTPTTGVFTLLPNMNYPHAQHTSSLMGNGVVLVTGSWPNPAELYDPSTTAAIPITEPGLIRVGHSATVLNDGSVLIAAGCSPESYNCSNTALRVFPIAPNTVTGSLTLPDSWVAQASALITISAISSESIVSAAALSNGSASIGSWIPIAPNSPVGVDWNFGGDGVAKPVVLSVQDADNRIARVVTGTVNVDTTAPASGMTPLPATSPSAIAISWSGSDTTSGVAGYDVQVRQEPGGSWSGVLMNTPATSTMYNGVAGQTYAFRVRARDVAGNVEAWPANYNTLTTVDASLPTGSIVLNGGALATTSRNVTLALSANDLLGSVSQMRFSADHTSWAAWQPYSASAPYTLAGGDGVKSVYAQFRDQAGNISQVISATIRLHESVGQQRLLSIKGGALWTNIVAVTLTIGAPAGVTQMQLSNDGGFGGAVWQPFDTQPDWAIIGYGTYVLPRTVYVRLRLADGSLSDPASDEIIYDPVPPSGTIAIASITPSFAGFGVGASLASVKVTLAASDPDNLSGVPVMRVASGGSVANAAWEPYATSKTLQIANTTNLNICAQFRDGAGNVSAFTCSDPNAVVLYPKAYLPITIRP